MSRIKITIEIEIDGEDEKREKALSILLANVSDTVRRTFKRLNFWSGSYDNIKYEMNIKTERTDKQ